MPGAINQMQMLYVPEEDRVLFRVNSTEGKEFRLWLTRRYCLLLLQVLRKHLESDPDVAAQQDPEARQAVQSFKQEQAVSAANFNEAFKEGAAELPLGEVIPLAFKLNYRIEQDNLHLGLQPKAGKGIDLVINRQINASIATLIQTAARQGEWGFQGSEQTPTGRAGQVVN